MERKVTIFDKIGTLIPGYRGYAEREGRRQCDKILRETISNELSNCENVLQAKITLEIPNKHKEILLGLEETRKRINTLCSRFKFASYGVSSFFSASQIMEQELDDIFKIDLALMEKVKHLNTNIDQMSKPDIDNTIAELERSFSKRDEFIKEHK
jgi:hypothetical protein